MTNVNSVVWFVLKNALAIKRNDPTLSAYANRLISACERVINGAPNNGDSAIIWSAYRAQSEVKRNNR